MKRGEFLKHMRRYGCVPVREGASHTLYQNLANGQVEAVPRHTELRNLLLKRICRRLGIPSPWDRDDKKRR